MNQKLLDVSLLFVFGFFMFAGFHFDCYRCPDSVLVLSMPVKMLPFFSLTVRQAFQGTFDFLVNSLWIKEEV